MKVIIVGNGFDLAHGIKSSYSDFLLYLLKQYVMKTAKVDYTYDTNGNLRRHFTDNLLEVIITKVSNESAILSDVLRIDNATDLLSATKSGHVSVKLKSKIIKEYLVHWSDFEMAYFNCIVSAIGQKEPVKGREISILNAEFKVIRTILIEYLKTIQLDYNNIDFSAENTKDLLEIFKSDPKKMTVVLNFNYTNTIEHYAVELGGDIRVIYIHGNINQWVNEDEIIFGFDDDEHEAFNNIILREDQRFIEFFKTSLYMNSNARMTMMSYLNSDYFDVYCLGHSLAQSDATILRDVFNHKKCGRIQIYFNPNRGLEDFNLKSRQLRRMLHHSKKWTDVKSRESSIPMPQPTQMK